jgi:hypothetical protein
VKLWLMSQHWDVRACKTLAAEAIAHTTARIMGNDPSGHGTAAKSPPPPPPPQQHLAFFVRALKLANRHPWHSRLWKLLYDAGDALAPRLRRAGPFVEYVRAHRDGADFARAVGIRDL